MKRLFTLVALIMFLGTSTFAQKGFHFGLKGQAFGSIFVNQQDSDNPNYDYVPRIGGAFMALFQYNFKQNVGVITGIGSSFLSTGTDNGTVLGDRFVTKFHNNYLTIPLHITVTGSGENTVEGYFYFGLDFHILTGVDISNNLNDDRLSDNEDAQDTYKDNFSTGVVGASMGGGMTINIAKIIQIFVGITAGGTFTDIYNNDFTEDALGGMKDRTTTWNGRAGGEFGVKYTLRKK